MDQYLPDVSILTLNERINRQNYRYQRILCEHMTRPIFIDGKAEIY